MNGCWKPEDFYHINRMTEDTKITLEFPNRQIILVGTAHISKDSIDEVNGVIREAKPSRVCVELDASRYAAMTDKDNWEKLDMAKIFKEGKGFLLMANLVLSGFQRRMGSGAGVKPGEEMRAALDTAKELGIPNDLCDREVQITLRRAWARCNLWSKCKLLAALLSSAFSSEKLKPEEIENLKQKNELDGMMSELAEFLPGVKEALIDERDSYLAAKIWQSGLEDTSPGDTEFTAPPQNKCSVVAVVGAGHLEGIKTHLEKFSSGGEVPDTDKLNEIPPKTFFSKAAGFIIPVLIIALIAASFFTGGLEKLREAGLLWVLWNGSLSAIGAILAFGHPFAILISFLGAPLTSLTPVIGVGLLTGLIQVTFVKPKVADVQNITDDVSSLKGIYRNRVSRALLVFFLSSLGSSIGTFVSGAALINLITK